MKDIKLFRSGNTDVYADSFYIIALAIDAVLCLLFPAKAFSLVAAGVVIFGLCIADILLQVYYSEEE